MRTKFQIRKRLNATKLKVFEKTSWVVGNSSAVLEKISIFLDIGATTGGSVYSVRTAALDVANGIEDYTCSDYKCLTLDCIACCCDIASTGISFLPKTTTTGAAFAGFTATSKFSRTLRNRCKEVGGLFGCK
jgi:hypothetical protein